MEFENTLTPCEPSHYSNLRRQLMSMNPSVESIGKLLKQTQEETRVVLTIEGRPNIVAMNEDCPPESYWEGRRAIDRFLDEGIWETVGPGFRQLREWVEAHWSTGEDKQAPNGAVATEEDWGIRRESQLDSVTATKKLIVAAKLHGREQVSKFAIAFAAHGMVEVRRVYLLKGPPIEASKPLDDFCSLLPYGEVLREIKTETDPADLSIVWPEPDSDSVCALECLYFEKATPQCDWGGQFTSPLLKDGPRHLALLLGLVWGGGFRILGNWEGVHPAAEAALPYRSASMRSGQGNRNVPLPLRGYGPPQNGRPLAVRRLHDLAAGLSTATGGARSRLVRAMERVRDSAERTKGEDRVIDVGVALSILFTEDEEQDDPAVLIPHRAAWYYSDSEKERQDTEDILTEFFERHLRVVRGRAFEVTGREELNPSGKLLGEAEGVLRACLMAMIVEGCPDDWHEAMKGTALRIDPPREESEIPSVKAEPLSWSIEEQREIDQTLEAVWRPVVEEAPMPPTNVGATVVSGELSEITKRYLEQGIPYIVAHPARLYVAHPKWPKLASEPLDERVKYYCGRDVQRHLRQWVDAAARKGLVQIEVPNDVDLYHPKRRDDWPQPMLSTHEDKASSRNQGLGNEAGGIASSGRSAQAVNEQARLSVAEEAPTDPPSELTPSVQAGLGREWHRLWLAFQHDVNVLTDSLLHLLDGIHGIHLRERQRLMQVMRDSDGAIKTLEDALSTAGDDYRSPKYPELRGFPRLRNEALFVRTAPGGSMEQTALRGWVVDVYSIWENSYRNQLKHDNREIPGAIRPQNQVIGDLGHIRNDLVHNGVAKRREAAGCEVLTWFSVGEPIQVRMRHIIDFLNQMAWLHRGSPPLITTEQGKASSWHLDTEGEPEAPPPALISVRPFINPLEQDPRYRYGASVAFENGVFGTTPMGPEHEENEAQAKDRTQNWMRMTVNGHGDLHIPNWGTVPAAELYRDHLKRDVLPGPGIPGPWVQFRE